MGEQHLDLEMCDRIMKMVVKFVCINIEYLSDWKWQNYKKYKWQKYKKSEKEHANLVFHFELLLVVIKAFELRYNISFEMPPM